MKTFLLYAAVAFEHESSEPEATIANGKEYFFCRMGITLYRMLPTLKIFPFKLRVFIYWGLSMLKSVFVGSFV